VYWPNGLHETHKKIAGNQLVMIREGVGLVPGKSWSQRK
jgi:hypothetical protein